MSNKNITSTDGPPPSTPQSGGDDLPARKLELVALERPLFKRPNFCMQAAVATAALAGVVGCAPLAEERALTLAEERALTIESSIQFHEERLAELKLQIEEAKEDVRRYRTLSKVRKDEYLRLITRFRKLQPKVAIDPDATMDLSGGRAEEIRRRVYEIVAWQMGVDETELTCDTIFANDLDADSLDVLEMIMEFEDEFEMSIPDEDAETIQTVGHAVWYLYSGKTTDIPEIGYGRVHYRVQRIVAVQFGVMSDEINNRRSLVDLGAELSDIVELARELEAAFNIEIPDNAIVEFSTVGDIVNYVTTRLRTPRRH